MGDLPSFFGCLCMFNHVDVLPPWFWFWGLFNLLLFVSFLLFFLALVSVVLVVGCFLIYIEYCDFVHLIALPLEVIISNAGFFPKAFLADKTRRKPRTILRLWSYPKSSKYLQSLSFLSSISSENRLLCSLKTADLPSHKKASDDVCNHDILRKDTTQTAQTTTKCMHLANKVKPNEAKCNWSNTMLIYTCEQIGTSSPSELLGFAGPVGF